MADEPLQQAEAALAAVAEQFERWRQTRATGQDRIPPSLWDQAVALATVLPCSRVARRLRPRSPWAKSVLPVSLLDGQKIWVEPNPTPSVASRYL